MTRSLKAPDGPIPVQAILVGERVDLRSLPKANRLASGPLVLALEPRGWAVVFRYGAIVFFNVDPSAQSEFLRRLETVVTRPYDEPECEQIELRIDPQHEEGVDGDCVFLKEVTVERLQLIADVLGASVALAYDELRVAEQFDRMEPVFQGLQRRGPTMGKVPVLLAQARAALLTEHKMLGRVEVAEKPDVLWEHPEFERLYLRLEDEFEIRDRHLALERKLQLIGRTAETFLGLAHDRRNIQLEWMIVLLIVVEIVIMLYEFFWRGG
jgi:uncharacterized Rmd1/YagE family protein